MRGQSGWASLPLVLVLASHGAAARAAERAAPRVLYVDDDNGTGQETGTAARPYRRIGAAVAAATTGDTVRVAAGVYRENVAVAGKVVLLLGGFAGGTAASYKSGSAGDFSARNAQVNVTRIDGSGAARAAVTLSEAGASVLEGFVISGGRGWTSGEYSYGGGVYVDGGAPTLRDNLVERNGARTAGGGIHLTNTRAVVSDNVVRNNQSAETGGGVSIDGGNVTLRGNVIRENVGLGDHGGGLIASGPNLEIIGNHFLKNEVGRSAGYGWGGGVIVHSAGTTAHLAGNVVSENYAPSAGSGEFIDDGAEALIENELIYRNRCPTDGGAAIYVDGLDEASKGSRVTIVHVTVADHRCNLKLGDGLYVEHRSSVVVRDSIFAGQGKDFFVDASSTLEISSTRSSAPQRGSGNTSADCAFADAAGGDYHLRSKRGRWQQAAGKAGAWVRDAQQSACIDAAAAASPFGREPAPNGGRANLGAMGNTEQASLSDDGSTADADGSVGALRDGGSGPGGLWGDAREDARVTHDAGEAPRSDEPRASRRGCAIGPGGGSAGAGAGDDATIDSAWIAVAGLALAGRRQQRRGLQPTRPSTSR
ncbi:MAG: DUF1565 domain-containing protein [Proteobacteria bacterium]|nr:DUF1565 domain-containing protein [Pseudomonadota bacterium]